MTPEPVPDDPMCRECSAAILESPSAIAALVRLVVTGAHQHHNRADVFDDLPF